jgi:hypothetical protein
MRPYSCSLISTRAQPRPAGGQASQFLASSLGKEDCRRGNISGDHMIAGCEYGAWRREISMVSFRELWSLPLDFVDKKPLQLESSTGNAQGKKEWLAYYS